MIKKQQKWIALLVVCTFMWLLQVSTMPVSAAGTTEQVSSANAEQGPEQYEVVSQKAAPAKKKSILPIILIGAGLITVTAIVVFVLLKGYNIVGNWRFYLTSITYPGWEAEWTILFTGTKKSGTFTDSDGSYGTYLVDGKNITSIKYSDISLTLTGQFDGKDEVSGTYNWTYYDEIGTWTGTRTGSGAAMPKLPSQFREKKNRELLSKSK